MLILRKLTDTHLQIEIYLCIWSIRRMDQFYINQLDVEDFFCRLLPQQKHPWSPPRFTTEACRVLWVVHVKQNVSQTLMYLLLDVIIRAPLSIKNGTQVSNSWLMWYDVIDLVDVHLGLYISVHRHAHEPLSCHFWLHFRLHFILLWIRD